MPASISSLSTLEAPSVRYPWFDEKSEQDLSQRHERILCPDGAPAEFDQPGIPKQNVSAPDRDRDRRGSALTPSASSGTRRRSACCRGATGCSCCPR